MKSIVYLDTSVGSFNQGDEIINISLRKNWPELFGENYIFRLASHTPFYTLLQRMIYRKRFQIIKNADYKFLCGTNAFYTNMLRPMPNWNLNLFNCGLLAGTVGVGVGIGVNSKKLNLYTRMFYKRVLSHEFVHSTRDEKTSEMLRSMGFKAVNTGCPTLWGLTAEHCRAIKHTKSDEVVCTLNCSAKEPVSDKRMLEILCDNYKKVFFWPQNFDDISYLRSMDIQNDIVILPPTVASFSETLDKEIDYVGNRLHGGIFAMQHKCRSVIISVDYRAEEMSKSYSFKCIERKALSESLESIIRSDWETQITGLDFDVIENWKKQFM